MHCPTAAYRTDIETSDTKKTEYNKQTKSETELYVKRLLYTSRVCRQTNRQTDRRPCRPWLRRTKHSAITHKNLADLSVNDYYEKNDQETVSVLSLQTMRCRFDKFEVRACRLSTDRDVSCQLSCSFCR